MYIYVYTYKRVYRMPLVAECMLLLLNHRLTIPALLSACGVSKRNSKESKVGIQSITWARNHTRIHTTTTTSQQQQHNNATTIRTRPHRETQCKGDSMGSVKDETKYPS